MKWLSTAMSAVTGFLPNVSMMQGAALASALAAATGGWIGYKVGVSQGQADKITSLEHAIQQSQEIAQQDAEILSQQATLTITRYRDREAAHEALNRSAVPDCSLDADGLRAIQDIYQPGSSRAHAVVSTVQSAESSEGWTPDYHLGGADRRSLSVSGVRGEQSGPSQSGEDQK